MPPKVVLGLFDSDSHRALMGVLESWSKNQLIRDVIICWTAPTVRFERVSNGEIRQTQLAAEVEVNEEVLLVHVASWSPGELDALLPHLDTSLAARNTILAILAASQTTVREPIVVLAPPALDVKIPRNCLKEGRRTLLLTPEERPAPGGTDHLVEGSALMPEHVTAGLMTLTGLWAGTEEFEVPLAAPDPHVTNGATARSVATYTRIVDVGYLADHIVKHTLRTLSGWPNPSPAKFDSITRDDPLLADLTRRYLSVYSEVLGPSVLDPLVLEANPALGLFERWRRFLRELWETTRLKPVEVAENVLRAAYNKAAVLTERFMGGQVDRWDDPEPPLLSLSIAAEERYRTADGPVRDAWWDLRRLCIGMVDGSGIPDWVPRTRVTVEADRRLIILDPAGFVPDPNVKPLEAVSACDPRALDPECGADLTALGPGLRAEVEAYAESRRSTVLWRVGSALASAIKVAREEVVDAEEAVVRLRKENADEQAAAKTRAGRLAKATSRFFWTGLLLGLGALAAAVGIGLTRGAVVTVVASAGFAMIWLLLMALLALRLMRRRRLFGESTTGRIVELTNQAVRAGARRADVDRLERRYGEFLDWAEILGWFLHEPWSPPAAPVDHVQVDRAVALPASVQRVLGNIAPETLASLKASARAAVFTPGWLDLTAAEQQERSARTYLALRENDPNPESSGRAMPDPYGDTRVGEGTPRRFLRAAVRDVARRRAIGLERIANIEEDLRERWRVDRIVASVTQASTDNAITAPAPGWAANPPELEALAARIAPSVAQVRRGDHGGTGVVIGGGRVLTNAHVVGYSEGQVDLYFAGEWERVEGTVDRISATTDLAVVRFAETLDAAPPVNLAGLRPGQGSTVLTLGHPLLLAGDPTLSWGYVAAPQRWITLDRGDGASWRLDVIQCSYASAGGASGSGVFNTHGDLIGIHCAGRVRDERADDFMSFAVPIDIIREFLDAPGDAAFEQGFSGDAATTSIDDEPLAPFLAEINVLTGATAFGVRGPWSDGSAPTAADVVFGASALDPSKATLEVRHGEYTVFVRSVTALSEARHAGDLKA